MCEFLSEQLQVTYTSMQLNPRFTTIFARSLRFSKYITP